jgi:hypothetical protein
MPYPKSKSLLQEVWRIIHTIHAIPQIKKPPSGGLEDLPTKKTPLFLKKTIKKPIFAF